MCDDIRTQSDSDSDTVTDVHDREAKRKCDKRTL